jgi:TonB family protein
MRVLAALAFGLFAAGAAQAADLNDPVWAQAPGQEDWAKAYPAHAAQAGISGAVKMKCAATSAGLLAACSVVQESPSGEGFGAAALSLATGMALRPQGANGEPVAGRNLIVPVRFEPALLHPGATVIGQPDWMRRPSQEEVQHFLPADSHGEAGHATIECVVTTRGLLEKCEINQETPTDHGFGASALAMTSTFLMRPMTVDGLPVGGARVLIPIGFQATPGDSPPATGTMKVMRAAPWLAAPTSQALAQAFPKGAVGKSAAAHVVLRCGFRDDGSLGSCETVSEAPDGQGFASAAKSLVKDFRTYVDPTNTAKLRGLRVDIPFDFRDPSQPSPPIEIYDPIWLTRVNPEAVAQLFPAAAAKAGYNSGGAKVDCSVKHDGSLTDCVVADEEPAGFGFGQAALEIAAAMKMNPWTAQGDPVDGGRIGLPVKLVLPTDQATPAAKP